MITPEMARQELAARAAARQAQTSQQGQITPEMARQELAARQAMRTQSQPQQPQMQQMRPQMDQQPSAVQQPPQDTGTPSFLTPFVSNAQASGAAKQLAFNPKRAGKVVTASALNTAEGLANLISKGFHYGTLGLSPEANMKTDYNQVLGVGKPQAGDEILAMAPLVAAPEGLPTEGLGSLGKLAARATEGEAYSQASGANAGTGATTAAAISIPDLLASSIKGRHAIPAALLKGTASPAERAANARAAGDLPIQIGQITQSPVVNKLYENILGEVPFSNVDQQQKAVAEGVGQRANLLLGKANGGNASILDPNELLKQRLGAAKQVAQKAKNEQYNNVDALAQQEGHQLELPSFTSRAAELKDVMSSSPLLQANPKIKSFMNTLGVYGDAAAPKAPQDLNSALTGIRAPNQAPSIRDANLAKNELYNAGDALSKSTAASDRYMGGIYKELSGLIAKDVKSSIVKTGSPQLQEAFNNANTEYRNNYGKFLKKDIFKYLDQNQSSDALARQIVKPSKANDAYSNIKLVKDLLPEKEKNLLPAAYLSNALDETGQVDVSKMGKLVDGLGSRQFNALFGKDIGKDASDYSRLMSMSSNARSQMANPKTGARTLSLLLGGGLLGSAAGPVSGAAIAGGSVLGSKMLSNYMTNPKVREKLFAAMERKESGKKSGIQESEVMKHIMAAIPKAAAIHQAQQKRNQ